MAFKEPDWQKDYLLKNCEVTGFVQLVKLKPNKFGKMIYQLSVLIDEKVGKEILAEVNEVLPPLEKKYKFKAKSFERITDILSIKRDKKTKEILEETPCPKGKLLLKLDTDSKDGTYPILMYDAKNQIIKDPKEVYAGSIVNVQMKLASFILGKDIGISLKLQGVQVVKANNTMTKNELLGKDSPFEAIEGAEDLEDEFIDDISSDDDDDEEEI